VSTWKIPRKWSGYATDYPMNWWPIKSGIKEAM
jgi:hypothetical protein